MSTATKFIDYVYEVHILRGTIVQISFNRQGLVILPVWQLTSTLVLPQPPLHCVEISLWDGASPAGQMRTAATCRSAEKQMFTTVVVSGGVCVTADGQTPL